MVIGWSLMTKGGPTDTLRKLERNSIIDPITGCWLWQGAISKSGYGNIRYNDNQISTHRFSAYMFLDFDLDSDVWILHKLECPYKHCWWSEHIYIGTPKENTRDADTFGRQKRGRYKTHCPYGHEYSPENTRINKRGAQECRTCGRNRQGYW